MEDVKESLENIEELLAMNLALNSEENDAIKMLYMAGFSSKEIGRIVGVNPNTVRGRIKSMRDDGEIE